MNKRQEKILELYNSADDKGTIDYYGTFEFVLDVEDAIEQLDLLDNIEVLRETLEEPSFARKLSKVKRASPIFRLGITKEAIVEFTKKTPELAGKFKYNEDGTRIQLGTKQSKIAFIKLLNDAFLKSELTKQYYDASAKDNITQNVK